MNKWTQCFIVANTLLASSVAFSVGNTTPTTGDLHGVEIHIGSIGTGLDNSAYRKLRQTIGTAVSNNVVDKFLVYGYGNEGGFSGCVEDRPTGAPTSNAFEKFVRQLNNIHPKSGTTYAINRISTCPTLAANTANKPASVEIAKADGSVTCQANSGIALTEMQKELDGISVYSAQKLSDGKIRASVCGVETGEFNVYEIAAADQDKAGGLGFVVWTVINRGSSDIKNNSTLTPMSTTEPVYECQTRSIGGQTWCRKYDTSFTPRRYIGRTLGRCPNNPPSNCP